MVVTKPVIIIRNLIYFRNLFCNRRKEREREHKIMAEAAEEAKKLGLQGTGGGDDI